MIGEKSQDLGGRGWKEDLRGHEEKNLCDTGGGDSGCWGGNRIPSVSDKRRSTNTKRRSEEREEELQHQRKQRTKEAQAVLDRLRQASSDERLCEDMQSVWTAANLAILEIQEFQEKYREDEEELIADANGILKEAKERAHSLLRMRNIEEKIQVLYDRKNGTVAMDTGKNSQIFRKVQQELWKIPKDYPKKRAEYDQVIERISKEWNYVNDDWNYETGTLKISVEPVETDYTHYWICHVQHLPAQTSSVLLCVAEPMEIPGEQFLRSWQTTMEYWESMEAVFLTAVGFRHLGKV